MSEPKILSLEQVRAIRDGLRPLEPLWTADAATVGRLCATVEHWYAAVCHRQQVAQAIEGAARARIADLEALANCAVALEALRNQISTIVADAPAYMDREDLARYLDEKHLDAWAVKTFSAMRQALDRLEKVK